MEAQKKIGTTEKSMYNDTAKKNVWKPKSKMGQPKKVCITTPQKRTYGSLKVKWHNMEKLLFATTKIWLAYVNLTYINMYPSGSVSDLIQTSDKSGQTCFRRCKNDQVARAQRYHNWYHIILQLQKVEEIAFFGWSFSRKKVCITTPQKRTVFNSYTVFNCCSLASNSFNVQ